jgi:SulP family sulfate permease
MSNVTALDVTAMQALTGLMLKCRNNGTTLLLSHPNEQPMNVLEKSGFVEKIGRENILENIDLALERANEIVIEK